jgi:hypothetical protein
VEYSFAASEDRTVDGNVETRLICTRRWRPT